VLDETKKQPFYCEDDEGKIRIYPGKAECMTHHCEKKSSGNRRYTETSFRPNDDLYVMGKAPIDKVMGDRLVFGHEQGSPYIIANLSEQAVMLRKALRGMGLMSVAVSLIFLVALLIAGINGQLSSLDFFLASMMPPIFLLFVMFALMYNDLVFLKQRCERNWANILISLKKRANLIPQLEEVVGQYLAHEKSLQLSLETLREKRRGAANAADFDRYMALEYDSIEQVSARIEQHPDLLGIDLISAFTKRLIKLENEIALIRSGYNDAVTQYRARIQSFPDNLLARLTRYSSPDLLTFDKKAHRVPVVKLVEQ
jgi:hypothetical protein